MKNPLIPARIPALLLIVAITAGCSPRFDAARFVLDTANIRYSGVFDPDYADITAKTEDDIRALYESGLEAEAEYFRVFFDIDKELIPDTLNDEIIRICEKMFARAEFEAGEANKTENGYTVGVTVRPVGIMQNIITADIGTFISDWQNRLNSGDFDGMEEAEFETLWAREIIELVNEKIDSAYQSEPETVYVRVVKESDKSGVRYTADEDDLNKLTRVIFPYR